METMKSTVLLSEQQVSLSSGRLMEGDRRLLSVMPLRENREKRQMGVKFLQPQGLH